MDEAQFYEEVIEPATSKIIENVYAVTRGTTDQFENLQQAIEDVLWPLLSAGDMGTMDPVVERQQMDEVESHVATLHTSMEIYVSGRWFGPSVEIQNKNYDNLRKVVRLAVLYEYGPDVTVSINSIRLVYTPSLSVVDED